MGLGEQETTPDPPQVGGGMQVAGSALDRVFVFHEHVRGGRACCLRLDPADRTAKFPASFFIPDILVKIRYVLIPCDQEVFHVPGPFIIQ